MPEERLSYDPIIAKFVPLCYYCAPLKLAFKTLQDNDAKGDACRFCQGIEAQKEGDEWERHIVLHVAYVRPQKGGPFAVFHAWTQIEFMKRTGQLHIERFKNHVRIYNGEALQCARCKVVTNDITAERGTLYCMKCTSAIDP